MAGEGLSTSVGTNVGRPKMGGASAPKLSARWHQSWPARRPAMWSGSGAVATETAGGISWGAEPGDDRDGSASAHRRPAGVKRKAVRPRRRRQWAAIGGSRRCESVLCTPPTPPLPSANGRQTDGKEGDWMGEEVGAPAFATGALRMMAVRDGQGRATGSRSRGAGEQCTATKMPSLPNKAAELAAIRLLPSGTRTPRRSPLCSIL